MAYGMRTMGPDRPGGHVSRMGSLSPGYGGRPGTVPSGAAMPRGGGQHGAADIQDLLFQDTQAYSRRLMPELMRGLRATRSRFGGGAIRSGGAQRAEELAYERLYANPLQDRIAMNARYSAEHSLRLNDQNLRREIFEEEVRQRELDRRQQRRAGVGRLVGTVVGGVGGFLLGGPAGAAVGAGLGGSAFG